MYAQFTARARKVMQLANQEARRANCEYIGTEHVLLGLVDVDSGVASSVLTNLGIELRQIRATIERVISTGPDTVTKENLPITPRSKKIIAYAMEEARNLNHNYVGTEHILVGMLRDGESVAGQILMLFCGLTLDKVRKEILALSPATAGRKRF